MSLTRTFARPPHLRGTSLVPGDKSISHRALLLAGLATGTSVLHGLATGEDVLATAACLRQLGVRVTFAHDHVHVESPGHAGWVAPTVPLDCGNSGTTMRLLMGLLAARPGLRVRLTGDASLSRRPMARVAAPLRMMGAHVELVDGHAPVDIVGQALHGAAIALPVASAQVKSAVLLAGMFAQGQTQVTEPLASRDHTERMLPALGVTVHSVGLTHMLTGPSQRPITAGQSWQIPGDPSSAAFLVVAALLHPAAQIQVERVSTNPTRTGFLDVLRRMGANFRVDSGAPLGLEPTGSVFAQSSPLLATHVSAAEVPALVDEVPILALAAAAAQGVTRFDGVGELRVKESDRLAQVSRLLHLLGVPHQTGADWLEVHGLGSTEFWSAPQEVWVPGLDHRMAMTAAIAGTVGRNPIAIAGFDEAVRSSWPEFASTISGLAGT